MSMIAAQRGWRVWRLGLVAMAISTGTALGEAPGEENAVLAADPVECLGVGWPRNFQPVAEPVVLPSERLNLRGVLVFPEMRLPLLDVSEYLAEDAEKSGLIGRKRVGVSRYVENPVLGEWHAAADGGRVWTASIVSEGAKSLRVHLGNLDLPAGAALYYYAPQDAQTAMSPIEGQGPNGDGSFWTHPVTGDTVHIELYLPAGAAIETPFEIDEISHNYRMLDDDAGTRATLACMVDVRCAPQWPTWESVSYSVAQMSFVDGGVGYVCTGQLLATQNADLTPYFLTANHCIENQTVASTLSCRWFYQTASCNGALGASVFSGSATYLAGDSFSSGRDWTLLMLNGALPTGVFWTGWTTANINSGVTVHSISHPQGSWKRYARGTKFSNNVAGYQRVSFNQGVGTIDGGSSGSGIWTDGATPATQLLFGDLSFGFGATNCDFPTNPVYYGRFQEYYAQISGFLAAGSDDVYENNDSCASAIDLGSGTFNNLVVKSLDEDWYRLSVGISQPLNVNLTFLHNNGNINMQLYNACGGAVVASGTSTTNNESFTFNNPGPPAVFYLRVYLASDTRADYSMTISGASIDCNLNGLDDSCDINCNLVGCNVPGCGLSDDCNDDQIPDECQLAGNDCDGNLVLDVCDRAALAQTISNPQNQSPCFGESATFSVSAPGATGYQWYRNGTQALVNGGAISGAQSHTLFIDPVASGDDNTTYSCDVSFGCHTVRSTTATLDGVSNELALGLLTPSPLTGCAAGGVMVLQVQASDGSQATYQWSKDGDVLTNGGRISGATSATLQITSTTGADSGAYTCVVSNPCIGPGEEASTTGIVQFADPVFNVNPQSKCAEVGQNAVFHGEASSPLSFIYRWYEGVTLLSDGVKFSGTTTDTLTVLNAQLADNGRQFRLRAIVGDPFCTTYSSPATLSVMTAGQCPACPGPAGDMDGDGDFDLVDMQMFTLCYGADVVVDPECACANLDDNDVIVNLSDWADLELLIGGPN